MYSVVLIMQNWPCELGTSVPRDQLYQLLLLPQHSGILAIPASKQNEIMHRIVTIELLYFNPQLLKNYLCLGTSIPSLCLPSNLAGMWKLKSQSHEKTCCLSKLIASYRISFPKKMPLTFWPLNKKLIGAWGPKC